MKYIGSSAGNVVAGNIQLQLRKKGRKQIELAEAIGVSKQTMSKILNGSRMVSISELKDIAGYFHVSMEKLMETETGDGNPDGMEKSHAWGKGLLSQAETEKEKATLEALFELSEMILCYSELSGQ